jgi:hypothetical protein
MISAADRLVYADVPQKVETMSDAYNEPDYTTE